MACRCWFERWVAQRELLDGRVSVRCRQRPYDGEPARELSSVRVVEEAGRHMMAPAGGHQLFARTCRSRTRMRFSAPTGDEHVRGPASSSDE